MVDLLLTMVINLIDFITSILPTIPADSPYYTAFDAIAGPFYTAFDVIAQIPILRLITEFFAFFIPLLIAVYVYKGIAWIYNAIRGHAG